MNTVNNSALAFLLALQDFTNSLSEAERQALKQVAQEMKTQPLAWEKFIEPKLLQSIQANAQLDQSYQFYKGRLDSLEQLPTDLLPQYPELQSLLSASQNFILKGFDDNSLPTGFELQIENAMIVVSQSDIPEQTVKKISSLDKLKQFLAQSIQ